MTRVRSPQARCRAGLTRVDITPPTGIYHRMWGAALHDRATGVHRPLLATLLWLAPHDAPSADADRLIVSLDHCVLDEGELTRIRQAISLAATIPPDHVLVTVTHTHGSGWLSPQRSALPGGELIGPYLDQLVEQLASAALTARDQAGPVKWVYGVGHCRMAAQRDFYDEANGRYVCGFNPQAPADDTVLIARLENLLGQTIGTVVNYACHSTTLAWQNTLISPDWVGAMRETVEQHVGGICLFLQGASGDLGPREGFVGDVAVADRNGRQVAFAALAALEGLPPAGTEFVYAGPVLSGTQIGTWHHVPLPPDAQTQPQQWLWQTDVIDLPYRADLPTEAQTTQARELAIAAEHAARQSGDENRLRDCRATVEQLTRQLARIATRVDGPSYPFRVTIGQLGDALWIFTQGELYQVFQTTLRARLAPRPVFVTTLTGGWQPGYIPPAETYGRQIYQEVIAATAPGSLEHLIEAVMSVIEERLV